MSRAQRYPMQADRALTFVEDLVFLEDFTGATAFALTIRDYPDDAAVLITLGLVETEVEGVRLLYAGTLPVEDHIVAGYLSTAIFSETNPETGTNYVLGDLLALSVVRVRVAIDNRITYPQERGDTVVLCYDLVVTLPGAVPEKYAFGPFTVKPQSNSL